MPYTIDNVQSDVTIAPVWEQLAAYTVGYYVVDTIGDGSGTHGALSVSVERKGMDSYENSEFVSGNTVYDGSTATFTASPENGYKRGRLQPSSRAERDFSRRGAATRTVKPHFAQKNATNHKGSPRRVFSFQK